jgi:hypothetical protein
MRELAKVWASLRQGYGRFVQSRGATGEKCETEVGEHGAEAGSVEQGERSVRAQGDERVDARGAQGWQQAGDQGDQHEQQADAAVKQRVERLD